MTALETGPARRPFVAIDEGLLESDLVRSFTALQRSVVLALYELANWTEAPWVWHGRTLGVIARGETTHALRSIAERAKVSKDVADGVVQALLRAGYLVEILGPLEPTTDPTAEPTTKPTHKPTTPRKLRLVHFLGNRSAEQEEPTPEPTTEPTTNPAPEPTEIRKTDPQTSDGEAQLAPSAGAPAQPPLFAAEDPPSPVVLELPCVGNGPKAFAVTQRQAAEWQEAFPGVDVAAQLRRVRVWLEANPTRRKTHRGVTAFLVRWLAKAQDEGRGGAVRPVQRSPSAAAPAGDVWEATIAAAEAATPGNDFADRLLRPLRARLSGDVLELAAPPGYQALPWLREMHGAHLEAWASGVAGRRITVRFASAARAPEAA